MATSKAVCVIGWPVEHSRSPLIHNYWIKQLGLDADYRREAVPPDKLATFVSRLARNGYVGANVTIPHKEAVLKLSDPDSRARTIGAANTLWLEGGIVHATNTDTDGFLLSLDAAAPGWDRGLDTAVVLGAGGAARAIAFALIERGVERISIANRSYDRAIALRDRFGERVSPRRWEEVSGLLASAGLLVNATSLGMTGHPALELNLNRLSASAVVTDVVYVPLETPLLATARQRGLRTIDGLGMLLYQAAGSFERWFGVRPEITAELRMLVEADLAQQQHR
jgi:shikimate dehydrogenase